MRSVLAVIAFVALRAIATPVPVASADCLFCDGRAPGEYTPPEYQSSTAKLRRNPTPKDDDSTLEKRQRGNRFGDFHAGGGNPGQGSSGGGGFGGGSSTGSSFGSPRGSGGGGGTGSGGSTGSSNGSTSGGGSTGSGTSGSTGSTSTSTGGGSDFTPTGETPLAGANTKRDDCLFCDGRTPGEYTPSVYQTQSKRFVS